MYTVFSCFSKDSRHRLHQHHLTPLEGQKKWIRDYGKIPIVRCAVIQPGRQTPHSWGIRHQSGECRRGRAENTGYWPISLHLQTDSSSRTWITVGSLFSSGNALRCCAVVEALKDVRTPCELLSQGARHVQRVLEPRAQEELDAGRVLPRAGQVQGWVGTEAPSSVHHLQQYWLGSRMPLIKTLTLSTAQIS